MREITGANTNESKRHYIADEELGGIPREYVETARKADVGDYVYIHHCAETPEISGKIGKCLVNDEYDDGSIDVDIPSSIYGSYSFIDADYDDYYALSPTDIIRHNGERYRLVDRTAEVGETILVKANEEIWMRDMTVGKMYEVVLDYPGNYVEVMDDVNDPAQAVDGNYYVIEPVIDEQLADAPPEPQPDLIDLVIRLSQTVADLEKRVNDADYKAGQAQTEVAQIKERLREVADGDVRA